MLFLKSPHHTFHKFPTYNSWLFTSVNIVSLHQGSTRIGLNWWLSFRFDRCSHTKLLIKINTLNNQRTHSGHNAAHSIVFVSKNSIEFCHKPSNCPHYRRRCLSQKIHWISDWSDWTVTTIRLILKNKNNNDIFSVFITDTGNNFLSLAGRSIILLKLFIW